MESINVAEAKSRFSELISRAAAGERFIIQRRDHPLAAMIGAVELERLERSASAARRLAVALGQDRETIEKIEKGLLHPAMAAFGLWQDEPDLQSLADEITADRETQDTRPGVDL
jgi:antitoxin (DNA-binding transcriptional repressor) of toxin-antitoxin stability system